MKNDDKNYLLKEILQAANDKDELGYFVCWQRLSMINVDAKEIIKFLKFNGVVFDDDLPKIPAPANLESHIN